MGDMRLWCGVVGGGAVECGAKNGRAVRCYAGMSGGVMKRSTVERLCDILIIGGLVSGERCGVTLIVTAVGWITGRIGRSVAREADTMFGGCVGWGCGLRGNT